METECIVIKYGARKNAKEKVLLTDKTRRKRKKKGERKVGRGIVDVKG